MTLNLDQYLVNIIDRECKVSHLEVDIWGGKTSKVKKAVLEKLQAKYGETILNDAQYILFFKGEPLGTAKGIKQLFKTVNRALGTNANNLSQSDFKKIEATSIDAVETPEEPDADEEVDSTEDTHDDEVAEAEGSNAPEFVFLKITLN